MLEKVRRTIDTYGLITCKSTVVVGFSGGVDSVCLLHLLKSLADYDLKLWALYVNHQLRPAENRQEIALLEELGSQWGIHTRQIAIDLPEKLRHKQQSLQLLAREERYKAFEAFREEVGADRIALAHHQDDQAETVLYRIIRGTGLDGLAGMPLMRDNRYIRPLMEVTRAEILEYAALNHLNWIEDSSNQKLLYSRNRIRHQLLPELEAAYNPRIKNGLVRLARLAREQSDFMESLTADYCRELIRTRLGTIGIKLEPFLVLHSFIQYHLLKKALARIRPFYQLELAQLEKIREKINREKNNFKPVHIYKGIVVKVSENWIEFTPPHPALPNRAINVCLETPGVTEILALSLRVAINPALRPADWNRTDRSEAYIDAARVKLPLTIRTWKAGDCFRPLGATGRQKLHDFFINLKIPREQRHAIPLLVDRDDRIIWVIGYRLSDDFKISHETTRIWHLKAEPLIDPVGNFEYT